MNDFTALDNPIWHSLISAHQSMARAKGQARRYASDVSPLSGLLEPTEEAFADLRNLAMPDESIALFTPNPLEIPADWKVVRSLPLEQMICTEYSQSSGVPLLDMQQSDVPEMLALTAATEPGPFLPQTIRMGRYYGIRSHNGRLIAMAGQRLNLDAFQEISAVCTDPEYRGQGHARAIIVTLAAQIFAEGKIPFLHVVPTNPAKLLYEKIGFRVRCILQLTVVAPQ
jgi:GNAT superfamily N-acetyltransferase